jgi:hypothetical protein
MQGITITLDLDALIIGQRYSGEDPDSGAPITFMEGVTEEVARLVFATIKADSTSNRYQQLTRRASEIRDEEIREVIRPAIIEAIDATMQPTDAYGNPKCEAQTLHEIIVEQAKKAITAKDSDTYSRTKGLNIVEQFIAAEVRSTLDKELKAVMDQAKADVLAAVKEQGAKVLSETIAKMAGIR